MEKLLLIDGNSIINRAFYGIMNSKMLMTEDGTYTNAVYGFLAIMFKTLEEVNPDYLAIAFDLKAPTHRHKLYDQYKANRKGMPNELASQMPILKDVLKAMNIKIIEKEGYEADDILGTLAKWAEKEGLDVTVLTGDRDYFQLASDNITIKIPRTKMGKTETEDFDAQKVFETYGVEPQKLIEVKGLMGDTSDNIPGVPGIGEKTAITLVKDYGTIEDLYTKLENNTDTLKGKLRENLISNKQLAMLSKTLGTIDINSPIEKNLDEIQKQEWDNAKVLEIFKKLRFNRFIERFDLTSSTIGISNNKMDRINYEIVENPKQILEKIILEKNIYYYIETKKIEDENLILKEEIVNVCIYVESMQKSYCFNNINNLKEIFENDNILKVGYKQKKDYILLKQANINPTNLMFDIEIAAYLLNSTITKYTIDYLALDNISFDIGEYINTFDIKQGKQGKQMNLFETETENDNSNIELNCLYAYLIKQISDKLYEKLKELDLVELFEKIEMPVSEVLAQMQYEGMYVDKDELVKYGLELQKKKDELTSDIYKLTNQEFNINSPKQLGEILFDKLGLKGGKKNKNGYSTDVDTLEKIKSEHPVIEKILDYRQIAKLITTYVDGLLPYINKKTSKIHSYFHQTVTATGRVSSSDPNLQNIPTRIEIGKRLRKVFKPANGKIYIDADYSQIELRVLAHISEDEHMVNAFNNGEDIHAQAASKIFNVDLKDVTKEQRSEAKAVNFGIVYGISDFGLGEQIGVGRKKAKEYIEDYLNEYKGIKKFMDNIVEVTKEKGYVETLYKRRRYVPEISSNNYVVRQFGTRVAMNTPIQGTAADIMKVAMINVNKELKENNLKTKLILQVHDELILEAPIEEKEIAEKLLKKCMENAIKLKVPLIAEISTGYNWYELK